MIVYFDPFYFKNGAESKPKYFIVLKLLGNKAILASLPSSKKHLPPSISTAHGCVEVPDGCINCYFFEAGKAICENNWSFKLPTYLYGQYLDEYDIEVLEDIYPTEGINYKIMGVLTKEEFTSLKECIATSASVKRKYRKVLG